MRPGRSGGSGGGRKGGGGRVRGAGTGGRGAGSRDDIGVARAVVSGCGQLCVDVAAGRKIPNFSDMHGAKDGV
ncbi:hypothetical protein EGU54_18900 [Achromobacter aegrifaciens]|nr:hypothetical protein EGU54_18900 [Achromobacter aegrifaciens]